jgi:phage terminase large subunit-like protein
VSRAGENIGWIHAHCRIPEGKHVGQPVRLEDWQQKILEGIYDKPTRRAIISFGRKNGKTSLASFLLLLHLCGPEAKNRPNSQLYSAAQSRDQAALLFSLAAIDISSRRWCAAASARGDWWRRRLRSRR